MCIDTESFHKTPCDMVSYSDHITKYILLLTEIFINQALDTKLTEIMSCFLYINMPSL